MGVGMQAPHRRALMLFLLPDRIRATAMAAFAATALALSGCSSVAPLYQSSNKNSQALYDSKAGKANVGAFVPASDGVSGASALSIRGGSMTSPYNGSYADYLGAALKAELVNAGLFEPQSSRVISGTLLRNTLDASIGTGSASISARFVVRMPSGVRFDKVLNSEHEWESSFMGAIAIPRARESYSAGVQKLLAQLFADAEFVAALRAQE